jgi:hypothetical protein
MRRGVVRAESGLAASLRYGLRESWTRSHWIKREASLTGLLQEPDFWRAAMYF